MGVKSPDCRRRTAVAGRVALSPDTLWRLSRRMPEVRRRDSGLRDPEQISAAKRGSFLRSVGLIDGAS